MLKQEEKWDHPNILIHPSFTLYKEESLMEKAKACLCMNHSTIDYTGDSFDLAL
jgi:hypothetical protein